MRLVTMSSTPGMGTVHNSQVELKEICDKVFYFYTPQLEEADVTVSPISFSTSFTPDYIEYIKENPTKKVGIIIDTKSNDYTIRDLMYAELDALDSQNVTTHNIIMMES